MHEHAPPDCAAADETAATEQPQAIDAEELARQTAELLPERNVMSLIAPGATSATPAAALLPDDAMQWHGPPDEPHIL